MNDAPQNNKKLFVGNLPWNIGEDQLKDLFSEFGEVVSANLITDRQTGRSRGFGFVEFSADDAAAAAVEAMHGKELDGRELVVNIARPKQR